MSNGREVRFTMKFQALFDPDGPTFHVPGFPQTLFPDDVPDEMQSQIKTEFYDFDIAVSPPWVWVERFHHLIKRHLYQWEKLLASEQVLRDDDALFNYDLTEKSTTTAHSEAESSGTGTNTAYMSDTPDGSLGDIENYMSAGSKNSDVSTGNSKGNSTGSVDLRRYGNIGVMTAAQILGGYREAMDYDAYQVIFAELSPLFLGSYDLEDSGEFVRTVDPW